MQPGGPVRAVEVLEPGVVELDRDRDGPGRGGLDLHDSAVDALGDGGGAIVDLDAPGAGRGRRVGGLTEADGKITNGGEAHLPGGRARLGRVPRRTEGDRVGGGGGNRGGAVRRLLQVAGNLRFQGFQVALEGLARDGRILFERFQVQGFTALLGHRGIGWQGHRLDGQQGDEQGRADGRYCCRAQAVRTATADMRRATEHEGVPRTTRGGTRIGPRLMTHQIAVSL